MAPAAPERPYLKRGPRFAVSQGLITVLVALAVLLVAGAIFAPTSIQKGTLLGMLPFAAVLVIVSLGQTLVVQQGGIDLSVPGAVSLAVVIARTSRGATTADFWGRLLWPLGWPCLPALETAS